MAKPNVAPFVIRFADRVINFPDYGRVLKFGCDIYHSTFVCLSQSFDSFCLPLGQPSRPGAMSEMGH
jgi:hypothetical protein